MDVTKKSSSTKNKYREDVVKSVKASLLMSQKLDYFAKRLPPHFKTPPNFSSMVMKSTSCEKCSSTSITYSSPCSNSFSFSTLSRFEHTIFEKFKSKKNLDRISCIRKISDEEKLKRSLRFSFNKDMKNFSYEKKLEKIENLSKNYEYSKHIVQIAKSNIVEGKKSHRESKLRLKFSKLEIRLKKGVRFI